MPDKPIPDAEIMTPRDLGEKLVVALRSVSDPQAIQQQIADRAVNNLRNEMTVVIDAMKNATTLWHDDLVRVPTDVQKAVTALRELVEQEIATAVADFDGKLNTHIAQTLEKFIGVGAQFTERDTRTDQRAGDTKLAVDAAFAAAKEATAKIEAGFTKQIDGMVTIIDTKTANLAGALGDVKDRITAIESRGQQTDPAITSMLANLAQSRDRGDGNAAANAANTKSIIAMVVAAVAVIGLGFSVMNSVRNSGDNQLHQLIEQNTALIQRLQQQPR